MVTKESQNKEDCVVCDTDLSIKYKTTLINMWGVCTECGCPYEISQLDEKELVKVEDTVMCSSWDYNLISNYYEEKQRPACLYGFCEWDDENLEEFICWAEQQYPDVEWRGWIE